MTNVCTARIVARGVCAILGLVALDTKSVVANCACDAVWSVQAVAGPSPRALAASASNSSDLRTYMFGGYTLDEGGTPVGNNELWAWDGTSWTLVATGGPSPRWAPGMAYDAAADVLVVYGGYDGVSYLGDIWEWDGAIWINTVTDGAPLSRPGMAYDTSRATTVIYGGSSSTGRSRTTMEYAVGSLAIISTNSPPGYRSSHSMAYDAQIGSVVMYGGLAPGNVALNDTWTYDGDWSDTGAAGPGARWNMAMSGDPICGGVAIHGGVVSSTNSPTSESWRFQAGSWAQVAVGSPVTPGARHGHTMAYDAIRAQAILFGGLSATGLAPYTHGLGCQGSEEFAGMFLLDLGDATTTTSPDGLFVDGIGSSGQDGFAVLLGHGDGIGGGLGLRLGDSPGSAGPDHCLDVAVRGSVESGPQQELGRICMRGTGSASGMIDCLFDAVNPGGTYSVEVRLAGVPVARVPAHSGVGISYSFAGARGEEMQRGPGDPLEGTDLSLIDKSTSSGGVSVRATVSTKGVASFDLGGATFAGDCLIFTGGETNQNVVVERSEVLACNWSGLSISAVSMPAFGHHVRGRTGANVAYASIGEHRGVKIQTTGSGSGTVATNDEVEDEQFLSRQFGTRGRERAAGTAPPKEFVAVDVKPQNPAATNLQAVRGIGTVGGATGSSLGRVSAVGGGGAAGGDASGLDLLVDFADLLATGVQVAVFDGPVLEGTHTVGPTGLAAVIDPSPGIAGWTADLDDVWLRLDGAASVTISGGPTIDGDAVRFRPVGGTPVEAVSSLEIEVDGTAPWLLTRIDTGVAPTSDAPEAVDAPVSFVSPNPFSTQARLTFHLSRASTVRVGIVDALGRRVRDLANGHVDAGTHVVHWDGLNAAGRMVPSGVYFLRVDDGSTVTSLRAIRLE